MSVTIAMNRKGSNGLPGKYNSTQSARTQHNWVQHELQLQGENCRPLFEPLLYSCRCLHIAVFFFKASRIFPLPLLTCTSCNCSSSATAVIPISVSIFKAVSSRKNIMIKMLAPTKMQHSLSVHLQPRFSAESYH